MRGLYTSLCIGFLLLNFCDLLAMSVQYVSGVEMPDVEYSLVIGKQDSLLHFYQQEANSDSVWVIPLLATLRETSQTKQLCIATSSNHP